MRFQKISILPPQKGLEFLCYRGSMRPKYLKKCIKLNWNIQRSGEVLEKSTGEVWIFSGTTQYGLEYNYNYIVWRLDWFSCIVLLGYWPVSDDFRYVGREDHFLVCWTQRNEKVFNYQSIILHLITWIQQILSSTVHSEIRWWIQDFW